MAILQYVIGGFCIAIGSLFYLRPQIMDWLDEQTNLRAAKERVARWDSETRESRRGGMRIGIPGILVMIGIGFILGGLT